MRSGSQAGGISGRTPAGVRSHSLRKRTGVGGQGGRRVGTVGDPRRNAASAGGAIGGNGEERGGRKDGEGDRRHQEPVMVYAYSYGQ